MKNLKHTEFLEYIIIKITCQVFFMMKQIIGGIKCQTIRYTPNNGWYCIAYPAKQKQVDSLLTKDFEWFLGTADEKLPNTMGHKRVGEIARAVAPQLHNYIVNVQGKLFPNNSMLVHPYGYKDPWYNIPWFSINYKPHPATKDFIKYVGHINCLLYTSPSPRDRG